MPSHVDFKHELFRMMREAQRLGRDAIEIKAGELHRRVGSYPGKDHRMPVCCQVMRNQFSAEYGDVVLDEPASGIGASLRIRYRLPRFESLTSK